MAFANALTPSTNEIARLSASMAVAYHVRDRSRNDSLNTSVILCPRPIGAMDNLASRLKQAREDRRLSQPALAKLAGVSQGTIGNIESGLRNGASSLALIAGALKVRYEWLRDGEGEMNLLSQNWPFEAVPHARIEALSERHKGRIEQAILDALLSIESESGKRTGLGG